MKFKAKKHDKLHLFTPNAHGYFEVEGFYCYGIKFFGTCVFPFFARLFYSCAYENKVPYYIVKKRYHYPFAIIFQFCIMKSYAIKQFFYTRFYQIKHGYFN
jgi:hypothetical protein